MDKDQIYMKNILVNLMVRYIFLIHHKITVFEMLCAFMTCLLCMSASVPLTVSKFIKRKVEKKKENARYLDCSAVS